MLEDRPYYRSNPKDRADSPAQTILRSLAKALSKGFQPGPDREWGKRPQGSTDLLRVLFGVPEAVEDDFSIQVPQRLQHPSIGFEARLIDGSVNGLLQARPSGPESVFLPKIHELIRPPLFGDWGQH
jgi:hypothetical protein